jgi:ABC-type transport system substrate-binding protein
MRKLKYSKSQNTKKQGYLWGLFFIIVSIIVSFLWHSFFLSNSKQVPVAGGIFTEATVGQIKNLNPLSANHSVFDKDLHKLLFSGLLKYDPINKIVVPDLAELKVIDAKTYELTLKETSKFSNGDSVTTHDIIFTFEEVIKNPIFNNTELKTSFEYVQIEVIDEKTVKFILPESNSFFQYLLTTPILPKNQFKNALIQEVTDPDFPFNKKPIGTGAFVLKNIVPNQDGSFRVFLDRNEFHYPKTLINQVAFYVYPNSDILKINHPWPDVFSRIPYREINRFKEGLYNEYLQKDYLLPRFTGVFFNLDRKYTAHKNLRIALRESLKIDNLLKKETGWIKINSPLFFEEVQGMDVFADTESANLRLRDHGFPYNKELEGRTFGKDGELVELVMITSTAPPVYSRFAQKIARFWQDELKLKINLKILSPAEFQVALKNRNYDVVLFGQNFTNNFDPLSLWHSSQSGKLNLSNLTREDIDVLIDEIRFSGAISDFFILNKELENLVPAVIFTTPIYSILQNKQLYNYFDTFGQIRNEAQRFFGIETWYFSQKRDWSIPPQKSKISEFLKWLFNENLKK